MSAGGPDQDQLIAQVRDAAFPLALRGYDREAVDAYVKRVNRLVTELEASRSPEAAIRRALEQVGEETSSILQRAQQTANEITERSRASADDRIREAEREARASTEEAEDRVRELEADYGAIWARRDRLVNEVRDLAERLLATADDVADRFPPQDEEAEVVETPRADSSSFGQLGPPEEGEETTVSAPFDIASAADFEDSSDDVASGFEPPEPVVLHASGDRPQDDEKDLPHGVSSWSAAPEAGEAGPSAGEEMDFADPLGGDDPDLGETPAEDPPREPRSP